MTIGVGVLATEPEPRNRGVVPSHVVLMADTMGSFGDKYSHPRLHKIFAHPEQKFYATAADQIDKAGELIEMINDQLKATLPAQRSYGDIQRSIAMACYMYKMERFRLEVYPQRRIPPEPIDSRLIVNPVLDSELQKQWEEFDIGCDLLIGAFDRNDRAFLFAVSGRSATLENCSFPGFAAIGIVDNTMFWLSHRKHTMGMSLQRAAYHAYEAKLMAEKSAHVNEHIDMLIADANKHWICSTHTIKPEMSAGCPISLADLKKWLEEYGVRDTKILDPS